MLTPPLPIRNLWNSGLTLSSAVSYGLQPAPEAASWHSQRPPWDLGLPPVSKQQQLAQQVLVCRQQY